MLVHDWFWLTTRRTTHKPWGRHYVSIPNALLPGFHLSCDHSICFPDSATVIVGPFQAFVGDFRPEFFQLPRGSLTGMPFGVIGRSWHLHSTPVKAFSPTIYANF